MKFVQASAGDVHAIEAAIAAHGLEGVRIAPAFLGRVVVQCPDAEAAKIVQNATAMAAAA